MSVLARIARPRVARAKPADTAALAAILADWIDETDWLPRVHPHGSELGFLADLVSRGWVTLVRQGGQPVGFMARDGAEVMALYVAGPARGTGVGSALVRHAKAKSPRLALWTFQFNHAAQAFYVRHGFVEVRRTGGAGNDEKLPDIRYAWEKAP